MVRLLATEPMGVEAASATSDTGAIKSNATSDEVTESRRVPRGKSIRKSSMANKAECSKSRGYSETNAGCGSDDDDGPDKAARDSGRSRRAKRSHISQRFRVCDESTRCWSRTNCDIVSTGVLDATAERSHLTDDCLSEGERD